MPFDLLTHLAATPFFSGIRTEVLTHLAAASIERQYAPGDVILREGDVGRAMLLILDGTVEVVKGQGEAEMRLSQRGAGDVFGEMAFFEARPRFATVRALDTVHAVELSETGLQRALAAQPELMYHTIQVVSARLRQSQEAMIADLQAKNAALEQAYSELKAAQAAVIEKERLERELELAKEIQRGILPSRLPRMPGLQLAAGYRPARMVGGDFYDAIELENGCLGLVMADVSDKGMPAALYMALARSLIRAEARRSTAPDEVLLNVNRLLGEISQASMFVTVFYGVLDRAQGCLHYARAGHDRPILRRSDGTCSFLNAQGIMLGIIDRIELEAAEVAVASGDRLLLYTDGVTDANDPSGEFYGTERLLELAGAHPGPAPALLAALFAALDEFQGSAMQYDDIAAMVVDIG